MAESNSNGNSNEDGEPPDSDAFYIARADDALRRQDYSSAAESYLLIANKILSTNSHLLNFFF